MTVRALLVPEAFLPSPGGIAVSAARIMEHLCQAGVEVWVVDFDGRAEFGPAISVAVDPTRERTILVTPFFNNDRPVRVPERVKADVRREVALRLTSVARSLGIQLVHSMTVFNAGIIATCVASALGLPHLAGVRGFGRHPFDGFRAECVRWVLERATAVVVANRSLFELLSVAHPTVAGGATCIPDSVVAQPYPGLAAGGRAAIRGELGFSSDTVMITLAANLREKPLLGSLLRVLASLPGSPVTRLLVVGRVHPGVRDQFDEDIGRLGLAHRVALRDWISQDAVMHWLEASDIVVMPSTEYGTTNVVLEAMERARCVVASDVFADAIRHDVNGILVDRLDPSALARALATLAANVERRNQVGSAARTWVLAERGPTREANAYLTLYQRLLES